MNVFALMFAHPLAARGKCCTSAARGAWAGSVRAGEGGAWPVRFLREEEGSVPVAGGAYLRGVLCPAGTGGVRWSRSILCRSRRWAGYRLLWLWYGSAPGDNPRARGRRDRRPGEGDDPHAPDGIDCVVHGGPGEVYRALQDQARPVVDSRRPVSATSPGSPAAPLRGRCCTRGVIGGDRSSPAAGGRGYPGGGGPV